MGSSKVSVSSASMNLMAIEKFPFEDAVLYAILAGENISNSVANVILGGMITNIGPMRTYAKNHYTLGLPQGSTDTAFTAPKAEIAAAIADANSLSHGVDVVTYLSDPLTMYYLLLPFLVGNRGYIPETSQISEFPATMELPTYSSTGAIAVNKVDIYGLSLADDEITITITYVIHTSYIDENDQIQEDPDTYFEETTTIDPAYKLGMNYCVASYYELDSSLNRTGVLQWWFYEIATNIYSALQGLPQIEPKANFLPVVPIRRNNIDLTSDKETELYKTSKKLLQKIKINIDDIADRINENPDVEEIDDAYVMFGINMQTDENIGTWYLGEFFDYLGRGATVNTWDQMNDILTGHDPIENTNVVNSYTMDNESQVGASEYGFSFKITFTGIETLIKHGSIGDVGTAIKQFVPDTSGYQMYLNGRNGQWYPKEKNPSNAKAIFKLQITPTVYKQIIVHDPQHINNIYRSHSVVTTMKNLVDDAGDRNFIIPVHYGIVSNMDLFKQNLLYQESLIIVLNSWERTKVAWYETSWFRLILMVIMIIITIYTGGLATALSSFMTALQAGFMALVKYILFALLFSVAMSEVMKLIAEAVGPAVAAILAIVIAIVVSVYGADMGTTNICGKPMPTSQLLLSASQSLMTQASKVQEEELLELQEEAEDFQIMGQQKSAELAAIQKELEIENELPDLLLAQSAKLIQHPITDPGQFYTLTIHAGNIGTHALDIIPEYHSQALKLPNVDETSFTNNIFTV